MTREIVSPTEVTDAAGRLRPEAVGWARHPILTCRLPRGLARAERFNYWCITGTAGALTILFADVGVAGVVVLSFLDFATRRLVERIHVARGGLPFAMPDTPDGDLAIDVSRLRLALSGRDGVMWVSGEARTLLGHRLAVDVEVERPATHETINVVVPWGAERFHLTSKQQALPARGRVTVDGREHRFGEDGFACLDFGRGRWPPGVHWQWAFASGPGVGFNLGATWTDGTGVNECGLVLAGRVHKLADPVGFRRVADGWRIAGPRVELGFTAIDTRRVKLPLVYAMDQSFGRFHGSVVDDGGARVPIDGLIGLAEEVRGRFAV